MGVAVGVRLAPAQQAPANPAEPASIGAVVNQYCVTCHNEKLKTGGLMLDRVDGERIGDHPEIWEKVARKLRAGMMPPAGARRPERAVLDGLASNLEAALDLAAAGKPNPGATALHRLNRVEYANAVRDLIGLEVDPATLLPSDDASDGFDNIADVLGVSPALLERYLSAASKLAKLAVGDPSTTPATATYRVPGDLTQSDHLEGLPLGTRGGVLIRHNFPLDAEYDFKFNLLRSNVGTVFGQAAQNERIELTIDGVRAQLVEIPNAGANRGGRGAGGGNGNGNAPSPEGRAPAAGRGALEVKLVVKAGPHSVGVAFLKKTSALVDDLWQPTARSITDANLGGQIGYTTLPHLASFTITGPFNSTGSGDTPSRRKIFACVPKSAAEESACARTILSSLARRAYRRPVQDSDLETLLSFYQAGRNEGDFQSGIELALRRILADPQFVFRIEREPENVSTGTAYTISDLELASRLSFFLWSSIPDDELLQLAIQGKLHQEALLLQQAKRMLEDPRSDALVNNFAGQWLSLRELKDATPESRDFDDNLRQSMRRETELFVGSILRENRSVLDLLNADYTFVDERLARHYGLPNIYGSQFRRVTLPGDRRRGLLGQASILTATSVANRTSPVQRGKWVLENILGTPAPLPPPAVPPLPDTGQKQQAASVRQRMEEHRGNPVCASCHKIMDPIGFALENFDLTGSWRDTDAGLPIDPSSQLVDGTKIDGPASLRNALNVYSEQFVRTFAEKMLTYSLGRTLQYYDMPVVRKIVRDSAPGRYSFSEIVSGVVTSSPFRMRVKKAPEPETQRADLAMTK
jgi:hypothetical protein